MEKRRKVAQQLPDLAFVFLIAEANADINVALAVLGQVLSLHQGDAEQPGPHPVLQLVLLRFRRPLVRHGLVLRRENKGLLFWSPGTPPCSRACESRTKGYTLLRGAVGAH